MIRGDSAICGTTTTGTGTLSLAACPTPPGGIDLDVLARMFGVGNSGTSIISYTIIEYTDATFVTAKAHEKGFGVLTLGASAGVANCTLARTTKQSSATSLNAQPATMSLAPTGISIGTAANTLVFIGPSTMDMPAYLPYYDGTGGTVGCIPPVGTMSQNTGQNLATDKHHYNAFEWRIPMLVKRCNTMVWSAYGGTSNVYTALYAIGTDGRPGRLLIDFGLHGPANASLASGFATIASVLHPTGFFLMPGEYYFNYRWTGSGATPAGNHQVWSPGSGLPLQSGRMGSAGGYFFPVGTADGTMTPAPDPAAQSGWYPIISQNYNISFTLGPI